MTRRGSLPIVDNESSNFLCEATESSASMSSRSRSRGQRRAGRGRARGKREPNIPSMVDYVAVGVRWWVGDSRTITQARAIPRSLEQGYVKVLCKDGKKLLAKGNRAARDPRSKGKIYGKAVGGTMEWVYGGGGEVEGGGRQLEEEDVTAKLVGGAKSAAVQGWAGGGRGVPNRGLQGSGSSAGSRDRLCVPIFLPLSGMRFWCPLRRIGHFRWWRSRVVGGGWGALPNKHVRLVPGSRSR